MQKRFKICPATDLEPGERIIVDLNGTSVGVFNVDGEYHALKNDCPHQRAPLCKGKITGTTTAEEPGEVDWKCDGHILRCPWHGWEFDIESGESVFNPHRVRARSFETAVESSDTETIGDRAAAEKCDCDVDLHGDDPPVDTYDTAIENNQVVVYL